MITFLTSIPQGPRNLLPLLTCFWRALGGCMREPYLVVAAALPKTLGHWCFERWKKFDRWPAGCLHEKLENHKLLFFFLHSKNKIDSLPRRHANFWTWVTRLPIEMNVHVAINFLTSPTNTSILSLSLENLNFKFVTLTSESTGCLVLAAVAVVAAAAAVVVVVVVVAFIVAFVVVMSCGAVDV